MQFVSRDPPERGERGGGAHARERPNVRLWAVALASVGAGAGLYLGLVRPLGGFPGEATVPWPLLILLFAVGDWWMVRVPLGRSAYSPSFSAIPLVIGLFLVAPPLLVPCWLAGVALGLAVARRGALKAVSVLGLVAVEGSLATFVIHLLLPSGQLTDPAAWARVIGVASVTLTLGGAAAMGVQAVSEGRSPVRRVLRRLGTIFVATALCSAIGLALVAEAPHSLSTVGLLMGLIASLILGYAAFSEEHQQRLRIQHLYHSRDLLQPSSRSTPSVNVLLQRLCQIFEADFAEVVLLPESPDLPAQVVRVREGEASEMAVHLDGELLEEVYSVLEPSRPSRVIRSDPEIAPAKGVLGRRDLKDAIMTALQAEGRLLGTVMVGDVRESETFADEECRLLEGLASQIAASLERLRLDERINHQAFHDALTGLANRVLFADRVAHALERRVGTGRLRAALLFIDLDDFKVVNDSLGHGSGDRLLQGVSQRLARVVRPFDTVARLGGDEFAVLIEDLTGPEEAVTVAERFLEELTAAFDLEGTAVSIGASVGIAIAGQAPVTYDELLRQADVAMYRAKERGKATVETFDVGMQRLLEGRVQMKSDLEQAVAAGELYVLYQPIINLATDAVVGVEALARWDSPRRGQVGPRDFIPVAETSGLICEIGRRVMRTACAQATAWMAGEPGRELQVSVNLSPRQLLQPEFVEEVAAILRETRLSPANLTLEITEGLLVENSTPTLERLRALKTLGVELAIDDFGTGYSSLEELKFLPVDALKIPKAFVDNVATDDRERAFMAAIIGLGRTLDLRLMAVGVEHAEQVDELRELRCDLAQGFHFAEPLDADGIAELLARGTAA